MGYSLAWIAVRGIDLEEALNRQGLVATTERADYAEAALSAMKWLDWSLIVARRCDPRLLEAPNLAALSAGCEVVVGEVEEHVMYSAASLWSEGRQRWRVEHDAQEAIEHLVADGTLPNEYEAVRHRYADQQASEGGADAEVDHYFEIPLVLARTLVGFKHDEVSADETDGEFVVLIDPAQAHRVKAKAWWQVWK